MRAKKRNGFSQVISTVIISGMVLAIGAAVWGYSMKASTIIAHDYINETIELTYEITERFCVEHVSFDNSTDPGKLNVTIFNYGNPPIQVNVSGTADTVTDYSGWKNIPAHSIETVTLNFPKGSIQPNELISINIKTKIGNELDYRYYTE